MAEAGGCLSEAVIAYLTNLVLGRFALGCKAQKVRKMATMCVKPTRKTTWLLTREHGSFRVDAIRCAQKTPSPLGIVFRIRPRSRDMIGTTAGRTRARHTSHYRDWFPGCRQSAERTLGGFAFLVFLLFPWCVEMACLHLDSVNVDALSRVDDGVHVAQ